jgi:N-acetylneuraminate lyase
MAVAEAWAACTGSDGAFKVMTLLGGTSVVECQDLARHAQRIGLYGVSMTAPFYFKPADASMLARVCIEVGAAVPELPFYYYHIPVLTGAAIPMINLLREIDGKMANFMGIKYTHEDFMDYLSCLHFKDGAYDMLWGRDENMLPALSVGARAAVGSTFNYAAPLYHSLIAAWEKGDLDLARRLQQQAIDMIGLLGKYGGIATGKAFMRAIGLECGEFRLPVRNMTEAMRGEFGKDLALLGFDGFKSDFRK